MAKRLEKRNAYGGTTDHSDEVAFLRRQAEVSDIDIATLTYGLLADLLEAHDQTGISLDNWPNARALIEYFIGRSIIESGV